MLCYKMFYSGLDLSRVFWSLDAELVRIIELFFNLRAELILCSLYLHLGPRCCIFIQWHYSTMLVCHLCRNCLSLLGFSVLHIILLTLFIHKTRRNKKQKNYTLCFGEKSKEEEKKKGREQMKHWRTDLFWVARKQELKVSAHTHQ